MTLLLERWYYFGVKKTERNKQMKKNDVTNEVRIHHSLWKNILLTIGCFAFATSGYFILHDANTTWPMKIFVGIGNMIFFGCVGMFLFVRTLYKLVARHRQGQ